MGWTAPTAWMCHDAGRDDEAQIAWHGGERDVARIEVFFLCLGLCCGCSVEDVTVMQGDNAEAPARGAEEYRKRVDAERIARAFGEDGDKVVGKCAVYVIGNDKKTRLVLATKSTVVSSRWS